jgi:hypothetical protein
MSRLPLCLVLISVLLVSGSQLKAQDSSPSPSDQNVFGVVETFWLPDVACQLHPGWERIIFDWSQHQPSGPDDWNTLNVDDRWLQAAKDCNREVVAVLKHTPAWATDGTPGVGVPRGLYLPVDDPNNLWASFVRKAAAYYTSRGVRRFIIWNEPDISSDTYGYEFEGTLDDYYQLLKVGYLAAKEGNPDAIIHIAGTTYWHDVNAGRRLYVDRLLEKITADPDATAHDDYFDVVTLHIYFRADTVYTIVRAMRDVLTKYNLQSKSIWIDETNASPNLDPQWPVTRPNWQINLDQQASFLVQAAGLGLAAGADHIGVYKFYDWALPPGGESFGLLRADGSRRPAFDTWAMVIQNFNRVTQAQSAQNADVDIVRLARADGQEIIIAWARTSSPAQIQVSASSEQAHLSDQYGNMMIARPLGNEYALTLSGALCNEVDGCPVGGLVSLLVQPQGDVTVDEITAGGIIPLGFQ